MEEVEKGGGEVKSVSASKEVEEIPGKQPAAASANLIGENGLKGFPLRHSVNEIGEIDSGEDS